MLPRRAVIVGFLGGATTVALASFAPIWAGGREKFASEERKDVEEVADCAGDGLPLIGGLPGFGAIPGFAVGRWKESPIEGRGE
jgi:hypothetical protein